MQFNYVLNHINSFGSHKPLDHSNNIAELSNKLLDIIRKLETGEIYDWKEFTDYKEFRGVVISKIVNIFRNIALLSKHFQIDLEHEIFSGEKGLLNNWYKKIKEKM